MYVTIAPIAPEHVDSFHHALDLVARERKFLGALEAPPLEKTREFVKSNIDKGNPQFVALAQGDVVGWCDVTRHSAAVKAHSGGLGMGLLADYRGRGFGRALLAATLDAARSASFTRIELGVYSDNPRAIALYERQGFKTEGISRKAVLIDGHYKDIILMAIVANA